MQAQQSGYRLQLDTGETLDCELAILADGGRSGLRQQLGIHCQQRSYQQTAIITNVTPAQLHDGWAFERFTPDGPMALLPMVDNRFVLIWTRPPAEAERLAALPEPAFLDALQDCFGYRMGRFLQVGQRHLYPLALARSSEQVRRNLVVLGNAAHSLHPIAGQGYNLSLRDAMTLADTLLDSQAPLGDLATLQDYVAAQQLDQDLTIGFSDQITRLFSNRTPGLSLGRRLGLLGLELCPPAKHLFALQAMGLGSRPVTSGSLT
jgi:2-octaprenyl-6-methoxyphenol hydroxylase